MLHYRSKRRGFTTYTAGQLKAVATTYFKTEMGVEVKESEIKFDTVHVSFQVYNYYDIDRLCKILTLIYRSDDIR